MALVRSVIRSRRDSGAILPLSGSTSAQTIVAPVCRIATFVGSAVIGVETTSSPGSDIGQQERRVQRRGAG